MYLQLAVTSSNKMLKSSSLRSFSTCTKILYQQEISIAKKSEVNAPNKEVPDSVGKPIGWNEAKPYESIPGPKPLPILGNVWRFLIGEFKGLDIADVNKQMYQTYGMVSSLSKLPGTADKVLIFDPVDIEMLFRNEGRIPHRVAFPTLKYYREVLRKDVFGTVSGLTTTQDQEWYNIRSKVNPVLMKPRTIQQYTSSLDLVALDFVSRIEYLLAKSSINEMPEDFDKELNKWALESVGIMALDRRFNLLVENPSKEALAITQATVDFFNQLYTIEFSPLSIIIRTFKTKAFKQFIANLDYITETFVKYINEAADEFAKSSKTRSQSEQSALEKLLAIDKQIALTMTVDMLTAGVDTTSKSVGGALYFLAKHKDKQAKLREELNSLLPSVNSPITNEVIAKASYLKACVKETLRMAPIAIANVRTLRSDVILGGYQVPKGIEVMACNLELSTSEKHYKEASKFIPERWLRDNHDEYSQKNVHPFVTLPFGIGPRSCVGQRMANLSMEIIIAKLIRNFELDWTHKDMKFATTLTFGFVDPLKLKMTQIKDS